MSYRSLLWATSLVAALAACSPATDGAIAPGADAVSGGATDTATSTPTARPHPSVPTTDWSRVEAVAADFMLRRQARDVAGAQAHLSEHVFFDWGPNDGRDGLAPAWAWEDAFRLVHTLDVCAAITDGPTPTARCRLRVDSEVAEVAGNEPGFVCIDVTVEVDLVTRVIGLSSAPGCTYDYWSKAFQPFARWLTTAHPDTSIDDMYRDRISSEGLERWRLYTSEFVAAGGA